MIHRASHDPYLVVLSVAIAIFGSYTALDLFRRVRATDGRARTGWLAAAATAMGLSIWSMHFVAMLAFDAGCARRLRSGPDRAVAAGRRRRDRRRPSPPSPAPTRTGRTSLAAGLFMGLGIAGMHYLGMAAMRLPVRLAYDAPLVALSLLVAVGTSTAALVLALREPKPALQVAGAVVAGLAIAGMHYVAMLALTLVPAAGGAAPTPGMRAPALAFNVAAATFFLLFLALVAATFDRRLAALALDKAEVLRRARDELDRRVVERTRDLADANDQLATEVAERRRAEAELRRARDELELRVEERTRALASANTRLEAEVAERRRAEAELREALDRLARHMDNTPLGVIELALEPGRAGAGPRASLVRPGGGDLRLADRGGPRPEPGRARPLPRGRCRQGRPDPARPDRRRPAPRHQPTLRCHNRGPRRPPLLLLRLDRARGRRRARHGAAAGRGRDRAAGDAARTSTASPITTR